MRVINLTTDVKAPSMCYLHIEQPMFVYHSDEEFNQNVPEPREILSNIGDYSDFIHRHNISLTYNSNNKFIDVTELNVWLRTIDKFIPETADALGNITYKLDENGNPIPTDNCYVRLYRITPTPTRNVFFTSSGVHTVGISKWNPTAAQRWSYSQETDPRMGVGGRNANYPEKLEKVIRKRMSTIQMTKVVSVMFNPASVYFGDFNGAIKAMYPWVKADDRSKLLETESFKRTLMSVLKTFFPDLAPKIREIHSPDSLAIKLQEAFDVAKESKNVKAMLDVFGAIVGTGYEETSVVNDLTGAVHSLNPNKQSKQIGAGDDGMPTDTFLNAEPELKMSQIFPDTELTAEEVKKGYSSSLVGMDNDEIEKYLDND